MCKYILIYSTYLIICSSFFIILCTFIIIWGALNIICGSSNIIFGKYYNMLCAFQSIWCTYYHYDDDDRSNIMPWRCARYWCKKKSYIMRDLWGYVLRNGNGVIYKTYIPFCKLFHTLFIFTLKQNKKLRFLNVLTLIFR